jgi:hypothetical protein
MVRVPATPWRRAAGLALVLAALPPGCASVERYARDRLMDVTDIVDFKYGDAWGFGFKIELTLYFGMGLGVGELEHTREWYGRHGTDFTLNKAGGPMDWLDGTFVQLGVIGTDGGTPGNAAQSAITTLGLNVLLISADNSAPPLIDRWRLGGEVVLPWVIGGMYLNVGELWDFFAGVAGYDPAGDDGEAKAVIPTAEAQDE